MARSVRMQDMQWEEIHLTTIDSTQNFAKKHASAFASDRITCIIAEEQTAGRGRFQRKWISPKGVNLYLTFYFRLPQKTKDLGCLGQVMAYSLAHVLLNEGLQPKIKWPNDIQLNGKKVAGILSETVFDTDVSVFLGVGINVNWEEPNSIDQPATSLKVETKREWEKTLLLMKIQESFEKNLRRFKKEGFIPFKTFIEQHLAYRGETVTCFDGKNSWTGICDSLAEDGRLNLLLSNGRLHPISTGDLLVDPAN